MVKSGKIGFECDDVTVEVEGNKIPTNLKSLGNKSYRIGEKVEGLIIDGKFNICRGYIFSNKQVLFGIIIRDELIEDVIKITIVANSTIGETIRIKRKDVFNY